MKEDKEPEVSNIIGGKLNVLGLNIDLSKLLSSPEDVRDQIEGLREKLKKAGGKEVLSDEEWKGGGASISGNIKTSGVLGDREYHIGTAGPSRATTASGKQAKVAEPPQIIEPPVDVFHEEKEIVVIAEVPGVDEAELELNVDGEMLSLSTKPEARRRYEKKIELGSPVDPDSLRANCRNGVLEVHLQKKTS
ncbi:MAG: Hsp20/alpha crystallin family protein [Chloroflexi bacterium]|nr:Hsp20/alpha crystallin family protein [Chloroflexota bacterium]